MRCSNHCRASFRFENKRPKEGTARKSPLSSPLPSLHPYPLLYPSIRPRIKSTVDEVGGGGSMKISPRFERAKDSSGEVRLRYQRAKSDASDRWAKSRVKLSNTKFRSELGPVWLDIKAGNASFPATFQGICSIRGPPRNSNTSHASRCFRSNSLSMYIYIYYIYGICSDKFLTVLKVSKWNMICVSERFFRREITLFKVNLIAREMLHVHISLFSIFSKVQQGELEVPFFISLADFINARLSGHIKMQFFFVNYLFKIYLDFFLIRALNIFYFLESLRNERKENKYRDFDDNIP